LKWPWIQRERLDAAHAALREQLELVEQQRQRLIECAAAQVHLQLAKLAVEQAHEATGREQLERKRLAGELLRLVDGLSALHKYCGPGFPMGIPIPREPGVIPRIERLGAD
jgi:hypothetical protein